MKTVIFFLGEETAKSAIAQLFSAPEGTWSSASFLTVKFWSAQKCPSLSNLSPADDL